MKAELNLLKLWLRLHNQDVLNKKKHFTVRFKLVRMWECRCRSWSGHLIWAFASQMIRPSDRYDIHEGIYDPMAFIFKKCRTMQKTPLFFKTIEKYYVICVTHSFSQLHKDILHTYIGFWIMVDIYFWCMVDIFFGYIYLDDITNMGVHAIIPKIVRPAFFNCELHIYTYMVLVTHFLITKVFTTKFFMMFSYLLSVRCIS